MMLPCSRLWNETLTCTAESIACKKVARVTGAIIAAIRVGAGVFTEMQALEALMDL